LDRESRSLEEIEGTRVIPLGLGMSSPSQSDGDGDADGLDRMIEQYGVQLAVVS
jgi:hypothetical protein